MKTLVNSILLVILAAGAAADTNFPSVFFNLKSFDSAGMNRCIVLTPQENPVTDGTNIYWALPLTIYPTNGVATATNLVPNTYAVTMDGSPGSWTLSVPFGTNGRLNAIWMTTNVPTM